MAVHEPQSAEIERAHAEEMHAKHPVTIAAGPYGHPFHPILVTVPIGAWIASLVFDIASRNADDGAAFARGAYWLIAIGIIGALVAALFGFIDLLGIPSRTRARQVAWMHMFLNLAIVAAFAASFIWRADRGAEIPADTGLFILSGVALAVLALAGWLGGMLAYRYGVRVADEETQLTGYLHNGRDTRRTGRRTR